MCCKKKESTKNIEASFLGSMKESISRILKHVYFGAKICSTFHKKGALLPLTCSTNSKYYKRKIATHC